MSLLDDVSIVVTPNGYKAGELYAVIPTIAYGSELVVNGDFNNGTTGWSTGNSGVLSVVDGALVVTGDGGSYASAQQIITGVVGKTYKLTGKVAVVSGSYNVRVETDQPSWLNLFTTSSTNFVNFEASFVCVNTSIDLRFTIYNPTVTSSDKIKIDDISLKEFTGADMDVTRATAATRVDEDGLVNYAEIIGSEEVTNGDFTTDTDWTKGTGWTISGNAANFTYSTPSSLTQDLNVTSGLRYLIEYEIVSNSGVSLKGGGNSFFNVGSSIPSTVGLHSFYVTAVNSSGIDFRYLSGSGSLSVTNISVKEITRDNVPRIDYTGGGCPHILAEPQRTNYNPKSEDIDTWSAVEVLREKNYTSPDGTLNAVKITDNSVNSTHRVLLGITTPSSGDFTYSVFLKKGTMTDAVLNVYSGGTVGIGTIDLENGTIVASGGGVNAKIEDYGNDWYRCSIGGTLANTSTTIYLYLSDSKNAYIGNGDFLYMAFAQLEIGSYATSYIPTSGSTVTRNQDIFTRDGIGSLINSTEGVLFVELENITGTDATNKMISITDGSLTNKISLFVSSNQISVESAGSGTNLGIYSKALQSGFNKIAVKYKVNDCALWVNGTEYTDTSFAAFTSSTLNALVFDRGDGTQNLFGKVKQLQVYKTALTDAQLTSLTS